MESEFINREQLQKIIRQKRILYCGHFDCALADGWAPDGAKTEQCLKLVDYPSLIGLADLPIPEPRNYYLEYLQVTSKKKKKRDREEKRRKRRLRYKRHD